MTLRSLLRRLAVLPTAVVLLAAGLIPATAAPTASTLYSLPDSQPCNKSHNFCVLYPKATALPSGRLVAAFEKSVVTSAGSAEGQTIPVYKSDDNGQSWQTLSEVEAPAYLSSNSAYAKYVSNWTNPYFYVLPQAVGNLAAGTLLLSTVVSGDDAYYTEQKAANPDFVPSHDGDRSDTAIALYASTDSGATWSFQNIIAAGGWSNGANHPAQADTTRQNDPVWEPYLMTYGNQLVAYYSDENDYTGYDTSTGVPTLAADNSTGPDSGGQILAHRTWNGTSTAWSAPVVDVPGTTTETAAGQVEIGNDRPGMTNVVPTTDGQWLMTFEYYAGGAVGYKVSSNPLRFDAVTPTNGTDITTLPVTSGSAKVAAGGNPVVIRLPDGRLVYNAGGSGDVWTNASGSSTGAWSQQRTTMPGAYSRNLTYVPGTGRVEIIGGVTTVQFADVDLGRSVGAYYKLVNRGSGKALGVLGASLADGQSVVQWTDNGSRDQQWHLADAGSGYTTLLNGNSGRALGIHQGATTTGANAVQWVQNSAADQQIQLVATGSYYKLVDRNSGLVLGVDGGSTADGAQVVQWTDTGAVDQQWSLVEVSS